MTTPPVECGLVSRQAIGRAIGLSDFYASGSSPPSAFSRCIISSLQSIEDRASMTIELQDPFPSNLESLDNAKARDRGVELPSGLTPGYSAPVKDPNGDVVGAKALGWTEDGTKVLVIKIAKGAPGRDHRADAVEFMRQLRPLLLT
ncbi:hypothetical protein [Nonomuraea sp. NPDC002799]